MPTTGSGQKRNRSRAKSQSVDQKWVIFGKRIADLRKDRGWLAYEVAKMIDVDPATISQLENGRRATGPEQSTLTRLADLYGVSTDSLLTGTETPRMDTYARGSRALDRTLDTIAADRTLNALEPHQIRAALYDALLAFFADIFEAVSESRARAATHHAGEIRSRLEAPAAQRTYSR
jgi:transcriptional regulator with XRE-family HTH domain